MYVPTYIRTYMHNTWVIVVKSITFCAGQLGQTWIIKIFAKFGVDCSIKVF